MSKSPPLEKLQRKIESLKRESLEWKHIAEARRESEERFRALTEQSPNMIFINKQGHVVYVNKRCVEIMGYTRDEFLAEDFDFLTLVAPDSRKLVITKSKRHLAGEEIAPYEYALVAKNGKRIEAIICTKLINYEGDQALLGIVTDISDRKYTESALRESEEKYRLLVENANEAIFIAQDNVIKFPNPKTENMLGYSPAMLDKIPFMDLIHPSDREIVRDRYEKRLRGERPPNTYSFRIIDNGGEIKWVELNTVGITWEDRPATLNFLRDITEKKGLEDKLQHALRMEAVGTLAAGIAHDFNNLLMGIQGNTTLMLLNMDSQHSHFEKLKVIEDYVQKGADLTKQLMGFTKRGKHAVRPIDVNHLVRKSSEMFGRTKKEITLYTAFEKDVWAVSMDQRQIEQVLIHLYVNASQAMPGGGAIHLTTENVTLDYSRVEPYGLKPGNFVRISVKDTGEGMDKKTQGRIFDPFFSSRKLGRGAGLGLAASYGIVKNHDGLIDVQSNLGKGTVFNIYLPAFEGKKSD